MFLERIVEIAKFIFVGIYFCVLCGFALVVILSPFLLFDKDFALKVYLVLFASFFLFYAIGKRFDKFLDRFSK